MAQKQKLIISGVEFILFPKIDIMMMLGEIQASHIYSGIQGVSIEQGNAYFSQRSAKSAAKHLSRKLNILGIRVPTLEEWLACIDQVQPLPKEEIPSSSWITEVDTMFSRQFSNKDINGKQVISELQLSHRGYRYAKTNIHCQNPNDGRYWTATPNRYIHLEGAQIWLNCITCAERGFSLRVIADIPKNFKS